MSLPLFPKFKPLELTDQSEIQKVTSNFPPYSDQDFISLWCWDTEESIQVSSLNNNIVFLMLDYLTKEKFYSFIGINKLKETVEALLALSKTQGYGNTLKLLPKDVITPFLDSNTYEITSDRDNFDYILHIPSMIDLKTKKNKSRRKKIELFESLYGDKTSTRLNDITDPKVQEQLLELFDYWASKKDLPKSEIESERTAIQRLFVISKNCDIQTTALYVKERLVGFSTDEIAENGFAVGHFMKANIDYSGSFQYLDHQVNLNLVKHDVEFINIEQDMGLEPLRISKLGLHPYMFLEKFTLTNKHKN